MKHPSCYPIWFRQIVLNSQGKVSDLAKRFCISSRTIVRWRRQLREKGTVAPCSPSPGRPRRLRKIEEKLLSDFIMHFPGIAMFFISILEEFNSFQQFIQMHNFQNALSF